MAVSFIVTGVVWKWVLSPGQVGALQGVNQLFGLDPASNRWITDAHVVYIAPDSPVYKVLHDIGLGAITSPNIGVPIALLSIVLAAVWQMSGFVMFCTWPASEPSPRNQGSRPRGRRNGVADLPPRGIPLLIPITLSAMIILGHISLKIYDLTVAMSKEGPGFATDTPANFMWQTAFRDGLFGRGAAVAIVMLLLVAGVVVPYLVWSRRQEVQALSRKPKPAKPAVEPFSSPSPEPALEPAAAAVIDAATPGRSASGAALTDILAARKFDRWRW